MDDIGCFGWIAICIVGLLILANLEFVGWAIYWLAILGAILGAGAGVFLVAQKHTENMQAEKAINQYRSEYEEAKGEGITSLSGYVARYDTTAGKPAKGVETYLEKAKSDIAGLASAELRNATTVADYRQIVTKGRSLPHYPRSVVEEARSLSRELNAQEEWEELKAKNPSRSQIDDFITKKESEAGAEAMQRVIDMARQTALEMLDKERTEMNERQAILVEETQRKTKNEQFRELLTSIIAQLNYIDSDDESKGSHARILIERKIEELENLGAIEEFLHDPQIQKKINYVFTKMASKIPNDDPLSDYLKSTLS